MRLLIPSEKATTNSVSVSERRVMFVHRRPLNLTSALHRVQIVERGEQSGHRECNLVIQLDTYSLSLLCSRVSESSEDGEGILGTPDRTS